MSLKTDIFDALKALVGNRVTPDTFPQEQSPTVPAIRYSLVGGTTWADLEGAGDEATDDVRIQIDWIAKTGEARDALTPQIRAAMRTLDPPCVIDGVPVNSFDKETRFYRGMGIWVSQGSSTT